MTISMKELWGSSHISAGHAAYLESLYETYITDPNSLSEEWINFFENLPFWLGSIFILDSFFITVMHFGNTSCTLASLSGFCDSLWKPQMAAKIMIKLDTTGN